MLMRNSRFNSGLGRCLRGFEVGAQWAGNGNGSDSPVLELHTHHRHGSGGDGRIARVKVESESVADRARPDLLNGDPDDKNVVIARGLSKSQLALTRGHPISVSSIC